VQVKSWSVPKFDDQAWHYRLSETHFNALAGRPAVAAYLFLVVVPRDARDYTRSDPDWLHLSQACYWASLAGRSRISNPRTDHYVPVPVPRQNLLSVEALTDLCARPVPIPAIAVPSGLAGTA